MNMITINELNEAKYYTAPLFIDKNFIILTPDIPITNELIIKLKKWGQNKIYTIGKESDSPNYMKENLINNIQDLTSNKSTNIEIDDETYNLKVDSISYYMKTLKLFNKIFRIFSQTGELNHNLITDKVKQMSDKLLIDKDTFLHLPDVDSDNYIIVDSVKATFLALALSNLLKLPKYRQIEIGIAAAIHDIGMFRIPSKLYLNERKLNPEELKKIKEHVQIGTKAAKESGFSKEIVQGIQEHHEKFDGSGYPFKSISNSISLYGRILEVICDYVASTSNRMFRRKKGNHFGIVDILKQTNKLYDPSIAKAFILMLSIYPLGTFVELMDGKKGLVIKTSMNDPKHPIVKIMLGENNQQLEMAKEIHTLKDGCHIKRALSEMESMELKNSFKKEI